MSADLTLAMIVRDGAKTLARCLESVRPLDCRIVVVDTGSKDDSIAIAKAAGAKVVEIPWPDAYDEARNVALDHVETEWALALDADEWLEDGAAELILEAIQNPDAAGYHLIRKDFGANGEFTEQAMLRLWRNRQDVRFLGVIHEQIYESNLREATGLDLVPLCQARFNHDGYVVDATPEQELNEIRLIKRELEIRPNQLYYQCMLACLEIKRDLPEGPPRLRRIVQLCLDKEYDKAPPHPEVALPLAAALTRIPAAELNANRTQRLVRICWNWFGDSPIVLYGLAELEFRRNSAQNAHRALCRIAELATAGTYSRHRSFDPAIFGPWLWTRLMATSKAVGAKPVLVQAAKHLLRFEPENEGALAIVAANEGG